jgi:serine/threonine protein kinase
MAPEQCAPSEVPIGPASDVFGLGATLFHALTGERPFPREAGARDASDPEVRFPQLTRGPRPLPRRTASPLRELLTAMLASDPAERPVAAEVAAALEPVVAELPQRVGISRGRRR